MRIEEITITNFKGFERETFRFNPGFNVVIGKNASGKTSLLDAVSVAASSYLSGIDERFLKVVKSHEIRTIFIDGQPKPQTPVAIDVKAVISGSIVRWQSKTHEEPNSSFSGAFSTDGPTISDRGRHDLMESRKSDGKVKFPLIVFYGTGRLWKHQHNINYFKQNEGVFSAYDECLSPNSSSEVFLSWYKTYEDEIKKFRQPADELLLKLFNNTISTVVPEWTDLAYSFKDDDLMGIFHSDGGSINRLPFKNLSDGYRSMIGMVADMVFRCIQLNPGLKEKAVEETEGIVLIDELDLHLHPEWQRKIVSDLKRVFPKIQFIATTHSPFIIQGLKKEELINLDKETPPDKDPWRESIEEIAENEMLVSDVPRSSRFIEMVDIAKEYFTLVKKNDSKDTLRQKIDDAKKRLDDLRIRFSDDPAYVALLETQLEKSSSYEAGSKN